MILIFCFSARTGDTSQQDSYRAGMLAGRIFVPGFEEKNVDEQMAFAKKVDHPIRKTAHATEYAILGMLIFGVYVDCKKRSGKCFLVPWLGTTLYAATDEFHQLFVAGRSGQVTDVMIDGAGALIGIGIVFILKKMKRSQNI